MSQVSLLIPGSYGLSVLLPIVVGTVPRSRRRRHLPPAPAPGMARRALPAPPLLPPPPALTADAEPDPAPPYDVLDLPPSYTESIESAVGDLARNHNSVVAKKPILVTDTFSKILEYAFFSCCTSA